MLKKGLIIGFIIGACIAAFVKFSSCNETQEPTASAVLPTQTPGETIGDKEILLAGLMEERDSLEDLLGYEVVIQEGRQAPVDYTLINDLLLFVDYKILKVQSGTYKTATITEPIDRSTRKGLLAKEDVSRDTTVFVVPPLNFLEFEQYKIERTLSFYYQK